MNEIYPITKAVHGDRAVIGMIGFLFICFLSLNGCDRPTAGSHIQDSSYKVVDTGYWPAEVNSLAEPLWLDNERIAFTSTESLKPGKPPYTIKVLNIATGEVVSTSLQNIFCVRDGIIVYTKKSSSDDQWFFYRGTLENSRAHSAPGPNMWMDTIFDCDWVPKKTYGLGAVIFPTKNKLRGKNYLEILERRTRLPEFKKRPQDRKREQERGDPGSNGKVIYHASPGDPGKPIPFYPPLYNFEYSEYLDAYVVGMEYYDPRETATRSFWILERNGDLKEVPYPKILRKSALELYPIKLGYLMKYGTSQYTETDPGDHGLYLVQGEKVQRLIVGSIHGVSLSSDGCKVAFHHARNVNESHWMPLPRTTVKFINFCKGEMQP